MKEIFASVLVKTIVPILLLLTGVHFIIDRALDSQTASISSINDDIKGIGESLQSLNSVSGANTEAISSLKTQQSDLFSQTKKIQPELLELEELKFRVQQLIGDAENITKYNSKTDQMLKRLEALEQRFFLLEDTNLYIDADVKIPESVEEKHELLRSIRKNNINKDALAKYIIQTEDGTLAEYAAESYFNEFSDEDIDFTLSVFFRISLRTSVIDQYLKNTVDRINAENIHLIEKSIYKYANDDFMLQIFLTRLKNSGSMIHLGKESLIRIRNFASKNMYKKTTELVDSLVLQIE